jgi:hypothetical protein
MGQIKNGLYFLQSKSQVKIVDCENRGCCCLGDVVAQLGDMLAQ